MIVPVAVDLAPLTVDPATAVALICAAFVVSTTAEAAAGVGAITTEAGLWTTAGSEAAEWLRPFLAAFCSSRFW